MEEFAQNEEMPAGIGDPENPLEQIKVLRRIIDKQAKEIIRLKKKVHVSEQRFGVSSGAPAGDTSDLAEEFVPNGSAMEEREPQLQQQFEKLSTRESYHHFAEEYLSMKEEIAVLKARCEMQQNEIRTLNNHCQQLSDLNVSQSFEVDRLKEELQGRGEESGEDDKDGNGAAQYNENSKQEFPHELNGFDNPFNCPSSCGFGVVFFILKKMGFESCNGKLIMEMQNKASNEIGNCSSSLDYFVDLGVLEEKEILFSKLTEDYTIESALTDAREKIKHQSRPVLLALEYKSDKLGHCVAIMPDNGKVIDVQNERYWNPEDDKPISRVHVVNVKENAPEDWMEKCGLHKCELPKCEDGGVDKTRTRTSGGGTGLADSDSRIQTEWQTPGA